MHIQTKIQKYATYITTLLKVKNSLSFHTYHLKQIYRKTLYLFREGANKSDDTQKRGRIFFVPCADNYEKSKRVAIMKIIR